MKHRTRNRRLSNLFLFAGLPLSARLDRPDAPATDTPATDTGGGVSKDQVTLTKAEFAELSAAKAERDGLKTEHTRLREFEGHAKTMLRGDLEPAAKVESTRAVLLASGYTKDQVEKYLGTMTGQQPPTGAGKGRGRQQESEDEQDPGDETDPRDAQIKQLEENQKQILSQQQNQEMLRLKGMLESSADFSLTDAKGMGGVVAKLKDHAKAIMEAARDGDPADRAAAEEDAKGVLALEGEIKKEIRDLTTSRLQYRRQTTGQWSDAWFAEEATKAAAQLVQKYRPLVIGLPNRIGRASGTESGEDQFRHTKPVEAPVYKPGMNNANAKAAVTDWAADLLGRASAELSREHSAV